MTIPLRASFMLLALMGGGFASSIARAQLRATPVQPRPETTSVTESVLYSFCSQTDCSDGNSGDNSNGPQLVQGSDGNFYGTTTAGGIGYGTVFKLTPTGALTTIYRFCSRANCADGGEPEGSLVQGGDGNFYGTTSYGGTIAECQGYGCGTVFKITPSGTLTTLYSFCSQTNCADGTFPGTSVVEGADGNYYGTTLAGGANDYGTVFKITPSGVLTSLYSFTNAVDGTDGASPEAALFQGSDGNFYGTTFEGGPYLNAAGDAGAGTFFKITPSGSLTTIYDFCALTNCIDGEEPRSSLVEGVDGNYYGTTLSGGSSTAVYSYGGGTAFRITSTGALTILYDFCSQDDCADGAIPEAGLIMGSDGNFYGTTNDGGTSGAYYYGAGSAFQLSPAGTLTTLYSFCNRGGSECTDGLWAQGSLVQGADGNFYGVTLEGGSTNGGVAYKLTGSPSMAGPVQIYLSNSSIDAGNSVTISWRVVNAISITMQQCYAFVQGGYAAAGTWTGLQTGTLTSGVYSGSAQITPTEGGVYTYALTCGGVESGFATLTVSGGTLAITTSSLPSATVGTAYSQMLVAQSGTPPYTWAISSGVLPAGLSLNSTTGAISGTPTTAGINSFVVKVEDSAGSTASASRSVTVIPTLKITTTSIPGGAVGYSYSTTLAATGGLTPYTWFIGSNTLPAGLALSSSTGVISGIPTQATNRGFTIVVTDAANDITAVNFVILVVEPPIVTTASLPNGWVGTSYSTTLAASNGISPYTWSINSGSLPSGLSLAASTGVISGTPTASGTSSFTVKVTDSENTPLSATANLSITINAQTLEITTTSLPTATVGQIYSTTLGASGGTAPYTWSVISGSLPAGLSLASSTGVISGTPTTATITSFTVQVTDAENPPQSPSAVVNVIVNPMLEVTTTSMQSGTVGTAYSQALAASAGVPPYQWTISSGSLPAGLSLAAATGVISGTPITALTSNFTATVTDSANYTAMSNLSITVNYDSLTVITPALATGAVSTNYTNQLIAGGGTAPYKWSINSGSLPAGLSLSTSTGIISGKPTGTGTSDFTVKVTDSASHTMTSSQSITVNAASVVRVVTSSLVGAITGTAYSATLAATSGTAPYTWSIRSGSLPPGLSLASSTGVISGTPTVAGTTSFIAQVTDSASGIATASLSITVSQALQVSTVVLPTAAEGTAYIANLIAVGGPSVRKWSVNSGSLPAGLTLNASTGAILGTPTATGTSSFIIQVAAGGYTATANLSITVNASSAVRIMTSRLPSGTVGTSYAGTMAATGGTSPYTWSVYSGSLPPGLTLNTGTGVISGTPSAPGASDFFLAVKDSGNNTATSSLSISIVN